MRRNRELELEKKELANTVRRLEENNAQLLADGSKLKMSDKFQSEELMRRNRELELEKKELANTARQLEENNAQLLADGSKLMNDKFALETTIKSLRQTQAAREQETVELQQRIAVLEQKNDGLETERDALDVKLREVREDVAAEAKKAIEKKAKHVEQDASERIEMLTDSLETMQARPLSLSSPCPFCHFLPPSPPHSLPQAWFTRQHRSRILRPCRQRCGDVKRRAAKKRHVCVTSLRTRSALGRKPRNALRTWSHPFPKPHGRWFFHCVIWARRDPDPACAA